MDPIEILRSARTAVLHDWPTEDVPHALVLAGLDVTFQGGPDPDDLYVMRLVDGHPETSAVTGLPERADIIYSHRPPAELPGLLAEAQQLGAATLWHQSGRNEDGEKDPWRLPHTGRGRAHDGARTRGRRRIRQRALHRRRRSGRPLTGSCRCLPLLVDHPAAVRGPRDARHECSRGWCFTRGPVRGRAKMNRGIGTARSKAAEPSAKTGERRSW